MKNKLELTDTMEDVLFKMSEGNPGALTVCLQIIKDGGQIDPDDAMGGIGKLLSLDAMGLHGSKIWMLYKDVCKQDLPKMLALLRGRQLGFVNEAKILHAVENYGDGINVDDICDQVVKRLPRFKLAMNHQES